jgi:hypothetical protein
MKTFGELSREEKIELFSAWVDGKPIEYYSNKNVGWVATTPPSWSKDFYYRVKVTQDYIDWDQVQPQYKWMARSCSGNTYLYKVKPELMYDCWGASLRTEEIVKVTQSSYIQGTTDWKDSLVERGE